MGRHGICEVIVKVTKDGCTALGCGGFQKVETYLPSAVLVFMK